MGSGNTSSTAICSQIMRSGSKHFVTFRVDEGDPCFIPCIIRPINNWESWNGFHPFFYDIFDFDDDDDEPFSLRENNNGRWGDSDVHVCMFNCSSGGCCCSSWEEDRRSPYGSYVSTGGDPSWDRSTVPRGSPVGMLLDLDKGTLALYSNNQRLGVLKSGLTGEYCWGVIFIGEQPGTVSITRGKVPTF